MFERFTDRARHVLVLAQEEARLLQHSFIGTEHILLGLIREEDGIAAAALRGLDISLLDVRLRVEETIGLTAGSPTGSPPFTPRSKKVLELSLREAMQLGHTYIDTEHLLLGLVREGEGVAAQVLVSLGAALPLVRQQVIRLLSGYKGAGDSAAGGPWPEEGETEGRVVACSFCGRGPPESGQLVSGANAFICERCIRRWSRWFEQEGPGLSRQSVREVAVFHHVAPTGSPPKDEDEARAEITAAFSASGTVSEDGRSVPTVEGGETLGPTLTAARERRRDIAPERADVQITVAEIAFVDATHAAVWFSISVDGRTLLAEEHRGDAVIVAGAWKMARSTFCTLMGMAGVPCPPVD